MKIVYVDESGTPGFNKELNGYFVLAGMVIDSRNILIMEQKLREIKREFGIQPQEEFKWNAKYSKYGLDYDQYYTLREEKINAIKEISDCVIGIVIDKKEAYQKEYINDHFDLYKQAFYLLMERVHMQLHNEKEPDSAIFVIDSRKNNKDATLDDRLAESFKNALHTGTWFHNGFPYFSETAFFTASEDCAGLQLADYTAGPIHQYFNTGKNEWYLKLRPAIRNINGKISGVGIKQFPTYPKIIL